MRARLKPDSSAALPMVRQLYLSLYDAIQCGDLPLGYRLPASRKMAELLGVARNTVVSVYEQLSAEALVTSGGRRGTQVIFRAGSTTQSTQSSHAAWPTSGRSAKLTMPSQRHLSLAPGEPDPALFPSAAWRQALVSAGRRPARELGYQSQTSQRFQEHVARFLLTYRSLRVDPAQIVATTGTRQSLNLAASLFTDPGDTAWIESPGYSGAPDAFAQHGLSLYACAVDDQGLVPPCDQPPPKLIYTTPCFHYPLGMPLSASRREALIKLSIQHGTVIFEDDYDSEFRGDTQPRPALAASRPDAKVLHAGTFSKLIFPASRVGWIVVPKTSIALAHSMLRVLGGGQHNVSQEIVAELLENGSVARHLIRAKQIYAQRSRLFVDALAHTRGVKPALHQRGFNLLIPLAQPAPLCKLEHELLRAELGAIVLDRYRWDRPAPGIATQLVVGLGNVDSLSIPGVVSRLDQAALRAQA